MKHGVYEGKVTDACIARSKSNALQVELLLEIEDGQTVSWFGGLDTDKAMNFTVGTLKALGLKDGNGPETIIGAPVKFQVSERESNGRKYEDVKIFANTGLRTRKEDRITGKDAASILFPKPYQPRTRERVPGDDYDDDPFR